MAEARPRRESQINTSAGHVFDTLRAVASAAAPIGGTEVARAVGVPVSTAHRALVTLEEAGFISRSEGGPKFRLGLGAFELVAALTARYAIRDAAQDCLRTLAAATGETCSLVIRLGWYAVCIDGHEGWQAVHRPLRIGERAPLHRTAAGRVLLAGHDAETVRAYARSAQAGSLSSVEVRKLRSELAEAAELGYAVEENAAADGAGGVATIAFAVRGPDGVAVAAIAVSGPAGQFRPAEDERRAEWAELVRPLEAEVAAGPARFADPFGHLPPDTIVLSQVGGTA